MASAFALTIVAAIGTYAWQAGAIGAQAETGDATTQQAISAAGFDGNDKAAVEAIIREYILQNPEIIPEAIEVLQSRQAASRINDVRAKIETPYANAFAGNPNGTVILVEYSDYACGFCRKSLGDVAQLIAANDDLKVVYQELPILSDESNVAAAWSLAAARQNKYTAFHKAMFAAGRPSTQTIATAAQKAGLDMTMARAFVDSDQAKPVIEANIGIAQRLEFSGTPSWVIGNQVLNGAVGLEALQDAVDAARAAAL